MNNLSIITAAAIQAGIFTEAEADSFIKTGRRLPLHTFAEWKRMGFSVKKGEKARMKCDIWRKSNKKMENEAGEEVENDRFYKKAAHFFTFDQVEQIATA